MVKIVTPLTILPDHSGLVYKGWGRLDRGDRGVNERDSRRDIGQSNFRLHDYGGGRAVRGAGLHPGAAAGAVEPVSHAQAGGLGYPTGLEPTGFDAVRINPTGSV